MYTYVSILYNMFNNMCIYICILCIYIAFFSNFEILFLVQGRVYRIVIAVVVISDNKTQNL